MGDVDDEGFDLIQPTLIQQLKSILDQYPDDGQILKELIQNAEDAGAKRVKFLHDKHSYPTSRLHNEGLAQFQGPALYAYNSARFSKEDWRGIRMLCDSIKVKDPMKVGRFGLGFKSVFHVTDLPSIFSDTQIGVIDPHEEHFADRRNRRTGYHWRLREDREAMNQIPDQFLPYKGIFDSTDDVFAQGSYNGTLFRFPLRTKPSELSQTLYSEDKLRALFESFMADAHLVLLFLQHIESIELYVRDEGELEPRRLFQVKIADDSLQMVQTKRMEFKTNIGVGEVMREAVTATFPISVETRKFNVFSGQEVVEAKERYTFLVSNYFCGGEISSDFKKLVTDKELSYLPCVGVAMPTDPHPTPEIQGHVFCFLPLPVQKKSLTGLPVHVNGFFALSQNRRHIKSPSAEQEDRELSGEKLTDKSLLWNKCLLEEAIPKAYYNLLMQAITGRSFNAKTEAIFRAWPDVQSVDPNWKKTLRPVFEMLFAKEVIYTSAHGGKWLKVQDAIFDKLSAEDPKTLIIDVLLSADQNVVCLPSHILGAIDKYWSSAVSTITPPLVRRTLKDSPSCYKNRTGSEKRQLLKFTLKDENHPELIGLELLPVSNGDFTSFLGAGRGEPIYISSTVHPQELLPGLQHRFVDKSVDSETAGLLEHVANQGHTHLRHLRKDDVVFLLPRALPPDWSKGTEVLWYFFDSNQNHPPKSWLELVWEYLRKNFTTAVDLSRFGNLPVIPLDMSSHPVSLTRLSRPSRVIVKTLNDDRLDDDLGEVLKLLGVVVMQDFPPFLGLHPAVLENFVHPPSVQGVSSALMVASSQMGEGMHSAILLSKVSSAGKRALRSFLAKASTLKKAVKQYLAQLPLLETTSMRFVAKLEGLCAAPIEAFPVQPKRELINIGEEDCKRFACMLDVKQMQVTEFLYEVLFLDVKNGRFSEDEIDKLMTYIIDRFSVYNSEDSRFKRELSLLPFVPKHSGRVTASELFDPRNETLKKLFSNEDVFPTGDFYNKPSVLVLLKDLGLKDESDVSGQDLFKTAGKIQSVSFSSGEMKSKALMTFLHSYPSKLHEWVSDEPLGTLLKKISWVLRLKERPPRLPHSLPFWTEPENERRFYKPVELISSEYISLLGSVKPVVEVEPSSPVAEYFGWQKSPEVTDVLAQLQVVTRCYSKDEKPYYMVLVEEIYSYLSHANTDGVKQAYQSFGVEEWVWNGDGFSSPKLVLASKPQIDLSPYICPIPTEVSRYSELFSNFGMRAECDEVLLLQVLGMIKTKHDSGQNISPSDVKRDLQLSIDILNEVKPDSEGELSLHLQEMILIPTLVEDDSRVRLEPVENCMYCEHEWLRRDNDDEDIGYFYVHPNIPNSTADRLGVPTLANRMLDSDELSIGEEFGQEEKLTRRLNRLLEDYTDGFAVPKELIQNADDAGATEVKFLYDERTNKEAMTCLIDEAMRECQGPALWVYNDAKFQDKDFENITKLNGGTKESDTEKIGKFGLGFNAVYNLTDVPSFVSRNYIAIFDPHTLYLGKAIKDKGKPGIRIDTNKNVKRLRKFRNQFKPFNGIFGCDLHLDKEDNSFNGTLFRFPLRTREQAIKSEIKQLYYDDTQMRELLEIFIRGARPLLLFTQNVRQVSILSLTNAQSECVEPKLIFQVSKTLNTILRELPVPVTLPFTAERLSGADQDLLRQCNFLRATSSEVAKCTSSKSLLSSSMTIDIKCSLTEDGKNFFSGNSQVCDSETWIVASSMGKGEALQYARKDSTLIPAAGVAVQVFQGAFEGLSPAPITGSGDGQLQSATLFCYLPLPIRSGLPVHVNGAFAVASNRRHLAQKTDDDKTCIGVEWNNVLFQDSICSAYLDLLEDIKRSGARCQDWFYSLWPRSCRIELQCKALLESFYKAIATGDRSLFTDGERWADLNSVVFLHPEVRLHPRIGKESLEVLKVLVKESEVVVDLPSAIFKSFEDCGLREVVRNRCYDKQRLFRDLFFPNISSVSPHLRDALTLYALDDIRGELDDLLRNYTCIPSCPNGERLKRPGELISPGKKAASLFSPGDERFPFGSQETFLSTFRVAKLEQLGMLTDDLPWDQVAERAESISKLYTLDSYAALKRGKALITFLKHKLRWKNNKSPAIADPIRERILEAKFLPVLTKPEQFPLSWKGNDFQNGKDVLQSPKNVFMEDSKYLVCCSEPLVSAHIPDNVKGFLKLDQKLPNLSHVICQLSNAMSPAIGRNDAGGWEEVKKVCEATYSYLQAMLNKKKDQVVDCLEGKKFILVGTEFVSPCQVAFGLDFNCSPYLYLLPSNFAQRYYRLMKVAGVRQVFEACDFVGALKQMKEKFGETSLNQSALEVALNLVNLLAKSVKTLQAESEDVQEKGGTCFLPDSEGVLRPLTDLCIKDCLWIVDDSDVNFVHDLIPWPISLSLGVKTRREEALKDNSFGISFGQKEKLTNRLKRILTGYPCEKEILKELLQNADDAQATEICFIKDPRHHPEERVFEDRWKPLQGPALCVYNNKPFTKEDIEGIQNLGEGSKGDDPNKTGQYGVGFNAVYHLTDAPSFKSTGQEIGDVLCVFDPHCRYVPGASDTEPGRMYTNIEKLKKIFPDVFRCYLEDHFPTENATMFRFPLRTKEMAMENKISRKSITIQQLDEMMRELKKELFEVLLFVNNVRKISFHDVDENSGEPINAYSVEVVMSEKDTLKRQEFARHVKRFGKKVKEIGNILPPDIKVKRVSYNLHLKDSEKNEEKWFIVQQIGFERPVNERIVNAVRKRELGMLPRGGVAYRLERKSAQSCSLSGKCRTFCFLPLPFHTDLPVHINGHFALDHEARRNLWREEHNDCRSEWNKALVQEVVASCYLTFLKEVRSFFGLPAAVSVKPCVVSCDKKELLAKVAKYEKVFPPCPSSENYWTTMATSVYQIMNQRELRLLPVVQNTPADVLHETDSKKPPTAQLKWLPLTGSKENQSYFNNLHKEGTFARQPQNMVRTYSEREQQEKKRINKRTDFEDILLESGFNIVAFSLTLFHSLKNSGVDVSCISPASVLYFFKTFNSGSSLCNVGSVPCAVKHTPFRSSVGVVLVLQYSKEAPHFLDYLPGTPLLLTNDHVLRVFDARNPTFLSRYQDLLPLYQNMFVEELVRRSIFSGSECHNVAVFRPFSVHAFASNLPGTLLQEFCTGDSPVQWFPDNTAVPNHRWICMVWQFLTDATRQELHYSEMNEESIMMSKLKVILAPLSNYCLLPVTEGNHVRPDHFLVPLNIVNSALDLTVHDAASGELVTILRSIGLHEVNFVILAQGTYLSSDTIRLIQCLAGSLKSPQSLISSIELKLKSKPDAFEKKLKPSDCTMLLRYFCDAVHFLQDVHKPTLRKLPIFLSTHGSLVKLGNRRVCVLPTGIPKEEMDMLAHQLGLLFLEAQPCLSDLFNFLKFEIVSTVDVYCNFILQHFKSFTRKAQVANLEHIRRSVLIRSTDEEKSRLLHCLKSVEFIPSRDGSLKTASLFYDPQNDVFRTMVRKDAFPPEPFNSDSWLEFLRTIGLVHQVSKEHFKTFAYEVEREGNTHPSDETREKSKLLVTHLFKRENVLHEGILEAVSGIRFVATDPAPCSLTQLCGQFGKRNDGCTPYIAFKGAVPTDHAEIVWTTASLLPEWANVRNYRYALSIPRCWTESDYFSAILIKLGVQLKPSIDLVATHCRNICAHLTKENDVELSPHQYLSRRSVMAQIYKFLQTTTDAGCAVRDCLQDMPCILVEAGRRFVQPKQVVLELSRDLEISPFLYGVPHELWQFRKLFQNLGCYVSLTPGHCAMVLQMMHERSLGNKLDPNEIRGTFKAVKAFFDLLQQSAKPESDLSTLYLPATPHLISSFNGPAVPVTLQRSTELIFNDAPNYKDRIESLKELFVVDLKKTSLRVNDSLNHKDLMMMLTEPLRPRMLSCVVKEKLVLTKGENSLVTALNVADSLKLNMSSPQFCRGLIRLIRHANSGVENLNEAIVHSIEDRLKRIEFFGINRIVTELWYNDLPLPGSQADVPYFVEKALVCGGEMWKVYVISSAGIEETISELSLTLTEIIAELCEGLLRDKAIFIPAMLASNPSKIWSLLDSRKIRQDDSYGEEEKDVFPEPGSFIPAEDHHLLNEDFEEFKPGDYVGYELDDPSLQMQEGEPIFIYAVIIEEATTEDGGSLFKKKYKINIGPGKEPIIADAADLYKFHRAQVITSALTLSDDQSHCTGAGNRRKIFDDISNALEAAWKLPESVKRKIIKRLYLRWHPDKNPGDEDFFKEVFQHIQSEISRLEKGESRQSASPFAAGTSYGGMYDSFFGFWGGRARRHRSQRNIYRENFSRYHGSWGYVPPSFCKTNPQPREARRWFRQAEADLVAADNDIATTRPSYEWACFKCQQAAEKALKAAQYAVDAFKTNVHNLVQISLCLDDSHLTSLAQQLDACVGDSTRMRYPDQVSFPEVPNDVYSRKMAQKAVELARQILDRVRDKVG